jgi:intracellular sulfur oxidation DsrE/DsrF family protein
VYYEVASNRAIDTVLAGVEDHLAASGGKASIVVLVYGKGVDFLREGARDRAGDPYRTKVQELEKRGVQFRVCGTTLADRHIDPKQIIPEGQIVSGGGAELKRLREQGYKRLN